MDQALKAAQFRQLHQGPGILVLANAWDAASARIFEKTGFQAIGTSSAGVAYNCGYADGQRIPSEEMLGAVRRIAACVDVPVTADVEAGYTDLGQTVLRLIAAGAVGLNLEDMDAVGISGLAPIDVQVDRIKAVRSIAATQGFDLVINARTDIYLAQIGEPGSRFSRTVERLQAFVEAGADCVFVPGVRDEEMIMQLVEAVKAPLNILATAGTPSVARLRELGVRRVSVGSGPARAAMAFTRRMALELLTTGTYECFTEDTIPYPEANELFLGRKD